MEQKLVERSFVIFVCTVLLSSQTFGVVDICGD